MTTRTVTLPLLRKLNACADQFREFKQEWPDGAEVTEANLRRAVTLGLDIEWFARQVLTAPAMAEYDRVTAPALAEYDRVRDAAMAEYDRVTAPALAEYDRVTDAALIDALLQNERMAKEGAA